MKQRETDKILQEAIDKYGYDRQVDKCIEECSELINALMKLRYGRAAREDVITEIADVQIMCRQMEMIFSDVNPKAVEEERERKIERLALRLWLNS